MENPQARIEELQEIQWQIAAFIDKHTENALHDDLASTLRQAFTDLNEAKKIIWDRAVADGVFNPQPAGEGDRPDDAKAS